MASFDNVATLFADASSAKEVAESLEAFKSALAGVPRTDNGTAVLSGGDGQPVRILKADKPDHLLEKALSGVGIDKALGADLLASVQQALETNRSVEADIVKDLTLTSPLASGYVAYDLEAPAKMLTPRPTPLRNRIPRRKGIGTSHRYKRITGFTGTGTGGVGSLHPGISDSTTTTFGSINYLRGPKISYAGDETAVPYMQFSLSDQVSWSAQFSGQGFQDIRQLSQTSVLYASMLMEERMMLMGRGTNAAFLGALAAPASISLTSRAPGAGEVGMSGVTTNIYVYVVSDAGDFGYSVLSAVQNVASSNGNVVDVKVNTDIATATGYRVFVGTGASQPANSAFWLAGRTGYNTYTIQGALPTSGTAASAVVADTSAYTNGYDGILPICYGPNSGYVNTLNSAFSSTNPGTEYQAAFASLYQSVKADPDEILFMGTDRKNLSDLLKTASSSNYRLTIRQDEIGGVVLGDVVTAIQNEVTGKVVQMSVHPWMPQGNTPILSYNLPIPDTEVSDVWSAFNVQDYMGVQWPVTQFAYETSSYWYGTFFCYAPTWNGGIKGIKG